MSVRKAVFAGSWYPADEAECRAEIRRFEAEFEEPGPPPREFVAGIVPHAGWFFSGRIACHVIQLLAAKTAPDLLLVFGMHLHPSSPRYMMAEGAWQTPLGEIEVDADVAAAISGEFSFELETPQSFLRDNTIELQMPFIRHYMPGARVLAMGVPPRNSSLAVARRTVDIAHSMGRKVKVLGSTDLTHYGPNYGFADHGTGPQAVSWVKRENDRRVIDAMLTLDADGVIREGVTRQNACCAGAAAAAVEAAIHLGSKTADLVSYATSYDKSPGDSFVGYAGIVI